MNPPLTVALSPHSDDLAFSLGGALGEGRFGDLLPVTVYSASRYIAGGEGDLKEISTLRKGEDRCFFDRLPGVRPPVWLDRLDAPVRLGIGAGEVRDFSDAKEEETEVELLASVLRLLIPAEARLLAPLALGGHIDHRMVHRAALRLAPGREVLFYEDLPYAAEFPPDEVERFALQALSSSGRRPAPSLLASESIGSAQKRAVRCYRSQISDEIPARLLAHPQRLRQGSVPAERVWTLT